MSTPNMLRTGVFGSAARLTVGMDSRTSHPPEAGVSPSAPISSFASRETDDAEAAHEAWIENDASLVPTGASKLLVQPTVLDESEVRALLDGLSPLLEASAAHAALHDMLGVTWDEAGMTTAGDLPGSFTAPSRKRTLTEGSDYEPHPPSARRDRGHPQLPSPAWLFAHDAGAGRPARHEQGHHLRARRRPGKKAGPPPRQAQGSLFGNRLG